MNQTLETIRNLRSIHSNFSEREVSEAVCQNNREIADGANFGTNRLSVSVNQCVISLDAQVSL